jgi:hypothetical protein
MKAILKLTKAQAKSNATYSISTNSDGSFRSLNITGNLISLQGFNSKEGTSYDTELVSLNCGTTAIITNEAAGKALITKLAGIYNNRALAGDKNPAVDLLLECDTLRPRETNILITNITGIKVKANTQVVDNNETINANLEKLRTFSNAKATVIAAPKVVSTLAAAQAGFKAASKLVKTHF